MPLVRRPIEPAAQADRRRRAGEQPARHHRRLPARHADRGHRGFGVRQVDAGQRHPARGAGQPDQRRPDGARPAHQGHRGRPGGQGGRRRPVADRPHPAVQPGDLHRRVRPRPQAVRVDHRGEGPRLPAGPVLVQRQGRSLRGLRRRRHAEDRDELPAGHLRAVRGVQGRPVQPGDARGALQGQEHRRGAGHHDRGGGGVLRGDRADPPAPQDAGRRRPRLRPARSAGADAVRRRGAAGQAGLRAAEAVHRPDGVRAGRADHRAALRRRREAARA